MLKYYDAASTTPTHPLVVEAMLPYFSEIYGNPSSNHEFGKHARQAVEKAREQIAELLKVFPDEVIFTSGATEAINLGIFGYWLANRSKGNHIVTVVTEHSAVLNTCANLEQFGVEVTRLSVNMFGQINFHELQTSIRNDTLLVAVMHVNNETGLIHDILEIGQICASRGVGFFTDATQAVGHVTVDYSSPQISMIAISGHKFQGPKGIGALVKKRAVNILPLFHGGNQENGLRPGTLPTPLIVGLGAIAQYTQTHIDAILHRRNEASNALECVLHDTYKTRTLIPAELRSAHIIPIICKEDNGIDFLNNITVRSLFMASTGSACSSGTIQQSRVVSSMVGELEGRKFVRFSLL
jgi:cysteine desulfurase